MLLLLSGPTGVGKTTMLRRLMAYQGLQYTFVPLLTYTTRLPRPTEKHAYDYFFISDDEFLELEGKDFFAEAVVVGGFRYGTARSALAQLRTDQVGCMVVNREGVRLWRALHPDALAVWLYVSDMRMIADRLFLRHVQDATYVQQRFRLAIEEESSENADPVCLFRVNNDLAEEGCDQLIRLVQTYREKKSFL